jgi:hypothetical protein
MWFFFSIVIGGVWLLNVRPGAMTQEHFAFLAISLGCAIMGIVDRTKR